MALRGRAGSHALRWAREKSDEVRDQPFLVGGEDRRGRCRHIRSSLEPCTAAATIAVASIGRSLSCVRDHHVGTGAGEVRWRKSVVAKACAAARACGETRHTLSGATVVIMHFASLTRRVQGATTVEILEESGEEMFRGPSSCRRSFRRRSPGARRRVVRFLEHGGTTELIRTALVTAVAPSW